MVLSHPQKSWSSEQGWLSLGIREQCSRSKEVQKLEGSGLAKGMNYSGNTLSGEKKSHSVRKNILTVRCAKLGWGRTTSPLQDSSSEYIYYFVVQSTLQILRYDCLLHLGKEQNRCPYKGQFNQGKITIREEFAKGISNC